MLDSLRFVATAAAKKEFVPELSHFKIRGGRITGYNGLLALSSDIDVDLDILPHAGKFLAAIRACGNDLITLSVTGTGRLSVKSGAFKSYVECLESDGSQFVEPEGETVELGEHFMAGIKALAPAMGIDASRPWAMGIKLQDSSMYATNNVMIAEYYHGQRIPFDVVIPSLAVNELLRIKTNPIKVQVTTNALTFWFSETRWMRTALIEADAWPFARIQPLLDKEGGAQLALPEAFEESVAKLKPFLGEHGSVYMTGDHYSTSPNEGEGSSVEISTTGITDMQAYSFTQLTLLSQIAKTIDWTAYPNPCKFMADRLRGVVVGQHVVRQ